MLPLLRFQKGPGWHPGLSSQLDDLHPQFDVEKINQSREGINQVSGAGQVNPASWPLAIFKRSSIICLKYRYVSLFLVDRGNRS